MRINVVLGDREIFLDMFMQADPSHDRIYEYLWDGILLRAFEGDETAGLILMVPKEDEKDHWEIKNLVVEEKYRHKGLGNALVLAAIFRLAKGSRVSVGIRDQSERMKRFYERCGFKYDVTIENYYPEHYDFPILDEGKVCTHQEVYFKQV